MEKDFDVIALGELLIDFTENGISEQGNGLFEANPGGAPCNLLAILNKFGRKTAFIGKVGSDQFGHKLKGILNEIGINTSQLFMDEQVRTTLAFVHTFENGDRDFSFYRNPGADMMLSEDEVDEDFLKKGKIFHFGTLSMTDEICRKATYKALEIAKRHDMLISFDPNLREPLWRSLNEAKAQMEYGFEYCDILKIADNEIQFVTGKEDYEEGVRYLQEKYQIPMIFLTLGKDGSRVYYQDSSVEVKGYTCNAIETTGAGDTFYGTVLHHMLKFGTQDLSKEQLEETLRTANAAAALITTKKGALKVMPSVDEISEFMKQQ